MARISYVDGRFVPHRAARVAMEDRGYQFADGVYEVVALYEGCLIDAAPHLARLERSLEALNIPMPMSQQALGVLIRELVRRNARPNGLIYLQVTRGVSPRNHLPGAHIKPVLSMSLNPAKYPTEQLRAHGVRVITVPDERWARCDIKSIALLPNTLARRKAQEADAREAWLYLPDGTITEGSLSNAYLVKGGEVYTHPADRHILGGITRDVTLQLAAQCGITLHEEPFTRDDIAQAEEAFMTGASALVTPITTIDDTKVGNGKPGPVTQTLMQAYDAHLLQQMKRG